MSQETWGIEEPAWKVGSTTFNLDYFVRGRDEALYETKILQSKITGSRTIIKRPVGWVFEGIIHLYKYADPLGSLTTLYGLYRSDGTLWRHRDGKALSDENETVIPFRLTRIERFFLTTTSYQDALRLKFQYSGVAGIDFILSLEEVLVAQDGDFIVTEGGLKIKIQ
jgi:hypothetical protein